MRGEIMKYTDMTRYQQMRSKSAICPFCGEGFTKFDDVQELKMKYGRAMLHFYFHSSCLLSIKMSSQLGEEVKDAETD